MVTEHEPAEESVEEMEPTERSEYYYNTRTGQVERGKQSAAVHRMGPYPTAEAAAEAYARAAESNEAWEEEDRAWRDEDD